MIKRVARTTAIAAALLAGTTTTASAIEVNVSIENLTNEGGLFLTPFWVGFHDGSFDLYDRGEAASSELERLAEDGATAPLSDAFNMSTPGGIDDTIASPSGPPPLDPGETLSRVFDVDADANRYFSYASMVIPSNDAFIANGDPFAHSLFDDAGDFTPVEILILGANVLDAGTEVNTELAAAFLNQTAPDQGDVEGGTVETHPGFIGSLGNPGDGGSILGGTNAAGAFIDPIEADFTQPGYQLARITITAAPVTVNEPAGLAVLALGLGFVARRVGRRRA